MPPSEAPAPRRAYQWMQAENVAFETAGVTIGPVRDITGFMQGRHAQARAPVADHPDEDMGSFPMHAITIRLPGTPGAIRAAAPRRGQHTSDGPGEARFPAAGIGQCPTSDLARTGA